MSETTDTLVAQREAQEESSARRNNVCRRFVAPSRVSPRPRDCGGNTLACSLPYATRVCSWSAIRRALALTTARHQVRTGHTGVRTMFA